VRARTGLTESDEIVKCRLENSITLMVRGLDTFKQEVLSTFVCINFQRTPAAVTETMMKRYAFPLFLVILTVLVLPTVGVAQEDRVTIDLSQVPAEGRSPEDFVPQGWKIEEQVTGDLNGDALPDFVLKLVEDKPAADKDGDATERQRALVIVLRNGTGRLVRAGVAGRLLQCTRCGGAFYGVVESPANIKIQKGAIVVNQDHGSRDISNMTYRFRYDPETQKFALIGFDFSDSDRLTGGVVSESTNYLTGTRVVTRSKGKRDVSTRTEIPRKKIYIEQVDSDKFEEDAVVRLKL
jgi:hypothetical protein